MEDWKVGSISIDLDEARGNFLGWWDDRVGGSPCMFIRSQ